MHFRRSTTTLASAVVISASLLVIAASSGSAKTQPTPAPAINFAGPLTCTITGQSAFLPPLTLGATGTSRVGTTGQLSGCTGNVTQHDWTITGGFVLPFGVTPSASSNCNGIGAVAVTWQIYWQAVPLAGATPRNFPAITKVISAAPTVASVGGTYIETWSGITTTGSFQTSTGSESLAVSPPVAALTSECTLPANAAPGISYITTAGTVSL